MQVVIAIDFGGTQIRAARVDERGNVGHRVALSTLAQSGPIAVMDQIAEAARNAAQGLAASDILGYGVSSPGPIDTVKGIAITLPSIPHFENFPVVSALEERLNHNIYLENDGIAAAIGEWKYGAGSGHQSVVYVTASTGIGGGVIVDGTVLRGRKGMAGHVGHLCIDHNGIRCNCGNTGCWERYAAGPFFAARAREAAAANPSSSLHAKASNLEPSDIFAAAKAGDELALSLVEEEATYLGVGITSLLHLFSPEVIVIGGGMSNAFDQLHPGISAYVADNAMLSFRDVPIVKAALGDNSGLIGAAALVFQNK
jgi:glucokinase